MYYELSKWYYSFLNLPQLAFTSTEVHYNTLRLSITLFTLVQGQTWATMRKHSLFKFTEGNTRKLRLLTVDKYLSFGQIRCRVDQAAPFLNARRNTLNSISFTKFLYTHFIRNIIMWVPPLIIEFVTPFNTSPQLHGQAYTN